MVRSRKFTLVVELSWVNLIVGWNWLRCCIKWSSSMVVLARYIECHQWTFSIVRVVSSLLLETAVELWTPGPIILQWCQCVIAGSSPQCWYSPHFFPSLAVAAACVHSDTSIFWTIIIILILLPRYAAEIFRIVFVVPLLVLFFFIVPEVEWKDVCFLPPQGFSPAGQQSPPSSHQPHLIYTGDTGHTWLWVKLLTETVQGRHTPHCSLHCLPCEIASHNVQGCLVLMNLFHLLNLMCQIGRKYNICLKLKSKSL